MAGSGSSLAAFPPYPAVRPVERALDLLFPPVCVGCRRVGRWICATCWPNVSWLVNRRCGVCGRPSSTSTCLRCSGSAGPLTTVLAATEFGGIAREAVHALKYQQRQAIHGMMGGLMAEVAREVECELVIPVPLHRGRRRERGYDQSALLARAVARHLRLPYAEALARTRKTQQQATLDEMARRANVVGAFACRTRLKGEAILLVDDVSTTGATIDAAAQALVDQEAGRITGLVFARAF